MKQNYFQIVAGNTRVDLVWRQAERQLLLCDKCLPLELVSFREWGLMLDGPVSYRRSVPLGHGRMSYHVPNGSVLPCEAKMQCIYKRRRAFTKIWTCCHRFPVHTYIPQCCFLNVSSKQLCLQPTATQLTGPSYTFICCPKLSSVTCFEASLGGALGLVKHMPSKIEFAEPPLG